MDQDEMINELAERMKRMQIKAREQAHQRGDTLPFKRGFHAKGSGVRATFNVSANLPAALQLGLFQPGATYNALVRFSNARSEVLGDLAKDQRGLAVRIKTVTGESLMPFDYVNVQDFLMTNTPISFARSPVQFIEVGEIILDGIAGVIPRLVRKYGFKEARRIIGVFLQPLLSFNPLQMNQYWSRTSFKFGETAIRFLVRPAAGSKTLSGGGQILGVVRSLISGIPSREIYLREKLREALNTGELRFEFCIQLFVDAQKTPTEDAYIEWKESDSPPIPLATLIIPQQDFDLQLEEDMEHMAFNPWHTRDFTPLGLINLARKKVYDASAAQRGATLPMRR